MTQIDKVEQLVLDKDTIALVVKCQRPLTIDARVNIRNEVQGMLKLDIPVIVLCDGMEMQVVKASEAVELEVR